MKFNTKLFVSNIYSKIVAHFHSKTKAQKFQNRGKIFYQLQFLSKEPKFEAVIGMHWKVIFLLT